MEAVATAGGNMGAAARKVSGDGQRRCGTVQFSID